MSITADDFRQVKVVAKNEMIKFIRGKKLTIYLIFIVLIFALITILPYALGGDLGDTPGEVMMGYLALATFLPVLAATLFASSVYVSEFEERTALILFTRPVKKTTIFIGKFVGCLILELIVIVGYYVAVAVVTLIVTGEMGSLLASLGYILLFLLAVSAVAAVFSSLMKKSGTAAIMTFITLLMLLSVVSMIIQGAAHVDPWFMLDQAGNAILTSIPEIADAAGMVAPDAVKTVGTMVAWTIVPLFIAWALFRRREF
jgi:ABC-2 type transport system permease protein